MYAQSTCCAVHPRNLSLSNLSTMPSRPRRGHFRLDWVGVSASSCSSNVEGAAVAFAFAFGFRLVDVARLVATMLQRCQPRAIGRRRPLVQCCRAANEQRWQWDAWPGAVPKGAPALTTSHNCPQRGVRRGEMQVPSTKPEQNKTHTKREPNT